MVIKFFLIGSVIAATLFLMRGGSSGRHLAIRRVASLAFAGCWVVAVLAPDLVTRVAALMGVGRGTDLVLYVFVVAFVFASVAQGQHVRELEDRLTKLTRELAIYRFEKAADSPDRTIVAPRQSNTMSEPDG